MVHQCNTTTLLLTKCTQLTQHTEINLPRGLIMMQTNVCIIMGLIKKEVFNSDLKVHLYDRHNLGLANSRGRCSIAVIGAVRIREAGIQRVKSSY